MSALEPYRGAADDWRCGCGRPLRCPVHGRPLDGEAEAISVVLGAAYEVYRSRNERYRDTWRRQGWRGNLFKARLKVERAWAVMWGAAPDTHEHVKPEFADDVLDAIIFLAMTYVMFHEGNRDGEWTYE